MEYLDLGEYLAEALLLEDNETLNHGVAASANNRCIGERNGSVLPYSFDKRNESTSRRMEACTKQNKSVGHKHAGPNEKGDEEEQTSGYWSESTVEKRLKEAGLDAIAPRAIRLQVSQRRSATLNYVDQDLRPPTSVTYSEVITTDDSVLVHSALEESADEAEGERDAVQLRTPTPSSSQVPPVAASFGEVPRSLYHL